MSNTVVKKPACLSLAVVLAFGLIAPTVAISATAKEMLQAAGASALVQPDEVFRADSVSASPTSYIGAEEPQPGAEPELVSTCAPSCKGCRRCCRTRYFYAGAEATFLVPDFYGSDMTFTVDDIWGGTTSVYSSSATALDQMYVGPRVWLGVQGECWGIVTRYWELGDSQLAYDPLLSGQVSGFMASHRFEAYTLDLELTRRFCCRSWKFDVAGGIRHAALENDSVLTATEIVDGDVLSGYALATREFHGTGLTFGLEGRKPICCKWQSNVQLFWKLRGSLLWGDIINASVSNATYSGVAGTLIAPAGARACVADDIGEVQLGIQCERRLRCLPATAFVRLAAEYQGWDANGGTTFANSTVFVAGLVDGTAQVTSSDVRTNLVGFTLGAGLSW